MENRLHLITTCTCDLLKIVIVVPSLFVEPFAIHSTCTYSDLPRVSAHLLIRRRVVAPISRLSENTHTPCLCALY